MVATKEERIIIPGVLESVLRYCLKDAQERMEKGEQIVPFSALAVKETLFFEEHPGDDVAECFHSARKTVQDAKGADAYGFCYDGYIDTDQGKSDCLIAEGGVPGAEYGHAIGVPYTFDGEGKPVFQAEPIYVSKALNYMLHAVPDPDDDDEEEEAETASEE
ncbi:MAG: hypothetical protein IJ111_06550 [Eggerthellaceae bacterium]|nr:hypothetical protein [Eggerthellaceae bacterium]